MTNFVIDADMISLVRDEETQFKRYTSALDRAINILLDQKIEPKNLSLPKGKALQDNFHVAAYDFALRLAVLSTKAEGKRYISDEGFIRFCDAELSNAAMIDGRPKGGLGKDGKGNTWGHAADGVLRRWKKALETKIAEKANPVKVDKVTLAPIDVWMKIIQQRYGVTQKADFTYAHDADMVNKALHMLAFAITGKDGQIKIGDKTKATATATAK
jgi:hypothetical protein